MLGGPEEYAIIASRRRLSHVTPRLSMFWDKGAVTYRLPSIASIRNFLSGVDADSEVYYIKTVALLSNLADTQNAVNIIFQPTYSGDVS
jgi:hypothetical protein